MSAAKRVRAFRAASLVPAALALGIAAIASGQVLVAELRPLEACSRVVNVQSPGLMLTCTTPVATGTALITSGVPPFLPPSRDLPELVQVSARAGNRPCEVGAPVCTLEVSTTNLEEVSLSVVAGEATEMTTVVADPEFALLDCRCVQGPP